MLFKLCQILLFYIIPGFCFDSPALEFLLLVWLPCFFDKDFLTFFLLILYVSAFWVPIIMHYEVILSAAGVSSTKKAEQLAALEHSGVLLQKKNDISNDLKAAALVSHQFGKGYKTLSKRFGAQFSPLQASNGMSNTFYDSLIR